MSSKSSVGNCSSGVKSAAASDDDDDDDDDDKSLLLTPSLSSNFPPALSRDFPGREMRTRPPRAFVFTRNSFSNSVPPSMSHSCGKPPRLSTSVSRHVPGYFSSTPSQVDAADLSGRAPNRRFSP